MLENIKSLKKDMEEKRWTIDSFFFKYNNVEFIVLVKLYEESEKRPEYASVKIEFLKSNNMADSLLIHANSKKLLKLQVKEFREYFNIEYRPKLRDIIDEFTKLLGRVIPTKVLSYKTEQQRLAMETSLNKRSDSEDPNKKYCYKVKRNGLRHNGEPALRSPYNNDITRLRRPDLYEELRGDPNLSFCYSFDETDEKKDEEILSNWTVNQKK